MLNGCGRLSGNTVLRSNTDTCRDMWTVYVLPLTPLATCAFVMRAMRIDSADSMPWSCYDNNLMSILIHHVYMVTNNVLVIYSIHVLLAAVFSNNVGSYSGGTVITTGSSTVRLSSCRFVNNTGIAEGRGGGGVTVKDDALATLSACAFQNNTAPSSNGCGGALAMFGNASAALHGGNRFHQNRAAAYGGAIYMTDSAKLFDSFNAATEFIGNKAGSGSGAIYVGDNLRFASAGIFVERGGVFAERGGVMYTDAFSHMEVTGNSSYHGNSAVSGAVLYADIQSTVVLASGMAAVPRGEQSM